MFTSLYAIMRLCDANENERESSFEKWRHIVPKTREQDLTTSGSKRVNRGYALREDLILDCKRIALDQGRKLYEVMEEALAEYAERHQPHAQEKEEEA